MRTKLLTVGLLVAAFLTAPLSLIGAEKKEQKKEKAKPYPLSKCVVADEAFGGDMGEPYVFVHEGREVKLCCKSCKKDFDKDTAKYIKKIDEGAKKVKAYKLDTCLVSDEKLGSMGDAYVFIHEGQEVKLCCEDCKKEFAKTPSKFISKLDKANKK